MHQRTFDQFARIVSERGTRRGVLGQFAALVFGLFRGEFQGRAVSAQALPIGSECIADFECAETEICSSLTTDLLSTRTYCCHPRRGGCSVDADCCSSLVCNQATCGLEEPPTGETIDALAAQDAACTAVELYPGYPGYRGFVAGLSGPGEVACLEQLQRQFPWFDRDREDQENAAAAVRLGLVGGPKDWVWENWLSIEAERSLPITCYTCAQEQIAAGESYQPAPVDPSDIRILVGSFNSNELLFRLAARNGLELWQVDYVAATDYQLRAVAWTLYPARHINAWELQSTYDALGAAMAEATRSPVVPAGEQVFWIALGQGGYAPTPQQAAIKDQVFLLTTALEAQASRASQGQGSALWASYNALLREWISQRATGSTQGLGQFLCLQFQQCISTATQ